MLNTNLGRSVPSSFSGYDPHVDTIMARVNLLTKFSHIAQFVRPEMVA